MNTSFDRYSSRAATFTSLVSSPIPTPSGVLSFVSGLRSLFDSRHLWGSSYFRAYSDDELVLLSRRFDMSMAQLDIESQAFVLDYAARRYVVSVDDEIARLEVDRLGREQLVASERYEARAFAIEEDKARIATMRQAVDNAIARTTLRIAELQAEAESVHADTISFGIDKEMVEADILGKELEAARAQLELQRSVMRVLEVKQEVAEVGLEISKTHVRVAELGADKVQWEVRIAENEASIKEFQAQKKSLENQSAEIASGLTQLAAQKLEIEHEQAMVAVRVAQAGADKAQWEARTAEDAAAVIETNAQKVSIVAEFDLEKAGKERHDFEKAKVDTDIEVLKAQRDEVQAQIDYIAVEEAKLKAEIAQWTSRVADMDASIANTAFEVSRLQREIDLHPAALALAEAEKESAHYGDLEAPLLVSEVKNEISLSKENVKSIEAMTDTLKARKSTVETAKENVEADIEMLKAEVEMLKADTARAKADKEMSAISAVEKDIAEKDRDLAEKYVEDYWPDRLEAVKARLELYETLKEDHGGLEEEENELLESRKTAAKGHNDAKIELEGLEVDIFVAERHDAKDLDILLEAHSLKEREAEDLIADEEKKVFKAKIYSSGRVRSGAIAAANKLAKADITSNLTHAISGA